MTLISIDSVISRDFGCLIMTSVPFGLEPGFVGEPSGSTVTEKERGCNVKAFREVLLRLTTPELAAKIEGI